MSSFRTKRIQKSHRDSVILAPKETKSSLHTKKKYTFFSLKILIIAGLCTMAIFFAAQIYIRAFSSNEQNGSESFTLKTIVPEFEDKKVKGTTNILIAGIGGRGHEGSDLTDSLMLASLDEVKNTVTFLSLPRDLYIAYPGKGGAGRINTLYDLGKRDKVGVRYLAEKVSEITGQPIDHYIVIDFSAFKQIIDVLGGIEVDVPEKLLDREYPDENWGYMTFQVDEGLQTMDGETALKYARSRHSTSDFDRSRRQQLIIKGIKERATDLGIVANPVKLNSIYDAIISHLDTDLSIANIAEVALSFSDIKSDDINISTLSDTCFSMTKCASGAFLYSPSRELFGGNAVLIPENAQVNKLSYYKDIRRFVDIIFRFPELIKSPREIVIVSDPTMKKRAQEIGVGLAKFGFPISGEKSLIMSTGSILKSRVNIYWNSDLNVGIDPNSPTVQAIKYLEESIPVVIVERNEYATTTGPKIEIIIGKDGTEYFKDLQSAVYIPIVPKSTISGEAQTSSGVIKKISTESKKTKELSTNKNPAASGEKTIGIDEWENF